MPTAKTTAQNMYEPQPGVDFADPKDLKELFALVDAKIAEVCKKTKNPQIEVGISMKWYNDATLRQEFLITYSKLGWKTDWIYRDLNGRGESGYDYYYATLE